MVPYCVVFGVLVQQLRDQAEDFDCVLLFSNLQYPALAFLGYIV